ncbi:hypothetical protein KKC45_03400 [Patescibacteria group bacterium]|nr:hypothetical protein [Patescibacteria group bacterium]
MVTGSNKCPHGKIFIGEGPRTALKIGSLSSEILAQYFRCAGDCGTEYILNTSNNELTELKPRVMCS